MQIKNLCLYQTRGFNFDLKLAHCTYTDKDEYKQAIKLYTLLLNNGKKKLKQKPCHASAQLHEHLQFLFFFFYYCSGVGQHSCMLSSQPCLYSSSNIHTSNKRALTKTGQLGLPQKGQKQEYNLQRNALIYILCPICCTTAQSGLGM